MDEKGNAAELARLKGALDAADAVVVGAGAGLSDEWGRVLLIIRQAGRRPPQST